MYNLKRTFWRDHVVDESGEVIQQGTMQDQAHFNNEEIGISDAHLAMSIALLDMMQHRRVDDTSVETIAAKQETMATSIAAMQTKQSSLETRQTAIEAKQTATDAEILGEYHTVTLTNSASYPFNSTVDNPTSIALTKTRANLYYSVEAQIDSATGTPGQIHIIDKALNGFKVYYDGSAASVTLTLRIKGGMA